VSKFKKGDRVKSLIMQHKINKGDLGTVDENDETNPFVKFDILNGGKWAMEEFDLALAEEKQPDGKKEGLRFNEGKLAIDQIPPDILEALADVYTQGSKKYPKHNWTLGMDWSTCIGCSDRHFLAWKLGESHDEETGCHHLAQAIWNLVALYIYEKYDKGTDDRFFQVIKEPAKFIKDKK